MKIGLVFVALLVLSVFAGSMTFAREAETDDDSRLQVVSASSTLEGSGVSVEIESETELEMEVDDSIESSIYRGYPAEVSFGTGWAVDDDKAGYLAAITWVSKTFVKKDNATTQTEVVRGKLHVGESKFTLRSDDGITFDVYEKSEVVGTLTLSKKSTFGTLTVWDAKLELDDGASYELSLATQQRNVRANAGSNSDGVRARAIEVECYDGAEQTFSVTSDAALADLQVKAREFCVDRCKDGKCGINSMKVIGQSGSSGSSETKLVADGKEVKAEAKAEVKSEKALERFWKRFFDRSGSNKDSE